MSFEDNFLNGIFNKKKPSSKKEKDVTLPTDLEEINLTTLPKELAEDLAKKTTDGKLDLGGRTTLLNLTEEQEKNLHMKALEEMTAITDKQVEYLQEWKEKHGGNVSAMP